MAITANPITARVITANPITANPIGGGGGEFCRYLPYFNGTSSYVESNSRIIDLDAVDPSFDLSIYYDLSVEGTLFSQNISFSTSIREFQIYVLGDDLVIILGGSVHKLIDGSAGSFTGFGNIKIKFVHSTSTVFVYKNGVLIATKAVTINASREPTAKFKYMARSAGSIDSEGFLSSGNTKDISIYHNSIDLYLPLDESVKENDGTIIYKNKNGDSNYDAVGYDIELNKECIESTRFEIKKLVVYGASILNQAFNSSSLNDEDKAGYGFSDLEVIDNASNGWDSDDYLSNIDSSLANYTGQTGVVYLIHGFGNNVSATRPYATATNQQKTDFYNAMLTIINKVQAAGHVCIWSGITYRAYSSNFPDESYGSLPYNENITYPLIQDRLGVAWDSDNNLPFFDFYNLVKNNQDWLSGDGVHFNTDGMIHFRNYIFGRLQAVENKLSYISPTVTDYIDSEEWEDDAPWFD